MKTLKIRATWHKPRIYSLPVLAEYIQDEKVFKVLDIQEGRLRGIVDYVRWEKYNVMKWFQGIQKAQPYVLSGTLDEIEQDRKFK